MTERAHEREIYKGKKRMPAPEISKPLPKKIYKLKKIFLLQCKFTEEAWKKWNSGVWHWLTTKNEWRTEGKYVDYKTAELVMNQFKRKHDDFSKQYEFRIVNKEDLKCK